MNFILSDNLNDFYVALIAIIATLNSVAIPLGYSIISEKLKYISDENVSNYLLRERDFRDNIILSIFSTCFYLIPLFLKIKCLIPSNYFETKISLSGIHVLASLWLLFCFLLQYIKFSLLIYRYASSSEEMLFHNLKNDIDKFFQK